MIGRKPAAMRCTRPARSAKAHHAEPKRHHSDQAERNRHRGFRAIESARCHLVQPIVPAADRDRQNNEGEPDVVQHSGL